MGGMTPEERARVLVLLLLGEGYPKSEEIAAKTIREALAEQREKDARIARAHNKHCRGLGHFDCVEAISEAISSQGKEVNDLLSGEEIDSVLDAQDDEENFDAEWKP